MGKYSTRHTNPSTTIRTGFWGNQFEFYSNARRHVLLLFYGGLSLDLRNLPFRSNFTTSVWKLMRLLKGTTQAYEFSFSEIYYW